MRLWRFVALSLALASAAAADEPADETEKAYASVAESARIYVPAKPVEKEKPKYPRLELSKGYEAWIYMSYCIDETGVPQNISIEDSVGDKSFERQAMEMVEDWRFEPARVDGQPSWQSNNQTYVYFAIDQEERGADPSFIWNFKKVSRLIDADKLDEADALFEKLFSSKKLSLYEYSKLWAQRAKYELKKGDLYKLDLALHRASASKGKWIDAASYQELLALRVRVEVKLEKYAEAISTYKRLRKVAGGESPAVIQLRPFVERVHAAVDGDAILKTSAEIRRKGECFSCNDSYVFRPARRLISFSDIDGELTSIEMRCKHKYFESDISDLVQWQIPGSWGSCRVEIRGEPGTTFNILTHPDA